MTAFVIGQMDIHSRDWMDEYFAKIPTVVADNSGKFMVRGGDPEHLARTSRRGKKIARCCLYHRVP